MKMTRKEAWHAVISACLELDDAVTDHKIESGGMDKDAPEDRYRDMLDDFSTEVYLMAAKWFGKRPKFHGRATPKSQVYGGSGLCPKHPGHVEKCCPKCLTVKGRQR